MAFVSQVLAIHGGTILTATAAWAVTFMLVGLAEEFAFRGYLQFTLTTGMGFWPSAFLLSALFGLAHAGNPGESKSWPPLGRAVWVAVLLLFCDAPAICGGPSDSTPDGTGVRLSSTAFPTAASCRITISSTAPSAGPAWLTGGSVGPEASIFTPVVLAVVATLFAAVYRENRYPTTS